MASAAPKEVDTAGVHTDRRAHRGRSGGRAPPSLELSLIGAFELRCRERPVPLTPSAQRLLAFLALRPGPLLRSHVAGVLWIEASEERACANLRSLLWRLPRPGCDLVESSPGSLRLARHVQVDVHGALCLAHRLLTGGCIDAGTDVRGSLVLGEILLPEWDDDWATIERERYRQLGLGALEALSEQLVASGCRGWALEVALAAVAGEPLRESAHRALIRVQLAEGNVAEAIRQYRFFKELLDARLGLQPSPEIRSLVAGFMPP